MSGDNMMRKMAPGSKVSKPERKIGHLRAKALKHAVAGRTKKAAKFAGRASKKMTKQPGYIGIPSGKGGAV